MGSADPVVVILVDHDPTAPAVLRALRIRASRGPAQYRLLVTNPAAHEAHLAHPLHPERHERVAMAMATLPGWERALAAVVGAEVLGDVSIRHDPRDALDEFMAIHGVDEVVFSVARHRVAERLHLDLGHRLQHLGVHWVDADAAAPRAV